MGVSPAHRFGQILGEVLERAVEPIVAAHAAKHHLYFDKKGPRLCRKGVKLSWADVNGNIHDLDFVLERGGSDEVQGTPVAFIEVAWRRYTKHSCAKAQEIQGAIMPLLQQYKNAAPFIGVVLAGVFTERAVQQLRSLGFSVLFIPTASIVRAFAEVGIDAAADENTPDSQFKRQVVKYEALSSKRKRLLTSALLDGHEQDVKMFSDSIERVLSRQIKRILVLPLHGRALEYMTIDEALASIASHDPAIASPEFVRYEIGFSTTTGTPYAALSMTRLQRLSFCKHTSRFPLRPTCRVSLGGADGRFGGRRRALWGLCGPGWIRLRWLRRLPRG